MRKIDDSDNFEENSELLISAEGLMGKQSVRATCDGAGACTDNGFVAAETCY